jgi:hypothetical protein
MALSQISQGKTQDALDDYMKCQNCHVELDNLQVCGKCRDPVNAAYCSKKCQVDHWPVHKKTCGMPDLGVMNLYQRLQYRLARMIAKMPSE